MSKSKLATAMLMLLTAGLVSACDPTAAVLDAYGGPTSLCTNAGDARCPRPPVVDPDDIKPN